VIATEDKRERAAVERGRDFVGEPRTDRLDLVEILRVGLDRSCLGVAFLGVRNREIARIDIRATDTAERRREAGVADRRGPHVDAPPVGSEVHWDADCTDRHGSTSIAAV